MPCEAYTLLPHHQIANNECFLQYNYLDCIVNQHENLCLANVPLDCLPCVPMTPAGSPV